MKITRILNYLISIIDNEDRYALDVLYFCLRRTFEKNFFTLNGIKEIKIDERFHPEPVLIKFSEDYSLKQKGIALLLSVRAIMLKPVLLEFCETDELFFKSKCFKSFEWVSYGSILMSLQKDDDFYSLFCMLEDAEYDGDISEDLKQEFHTNTILPPYKNLDNYYKKIAKGEIRNKGIVIVNNAYLGDEALSSLEIPKTVEYIGDTAIAYCENLQEIVFMRDDLKFGIFPIIECPQLKSIIVPEGSEEYYKEQLPYYKNIISESKTDSQDVCLKEPVEVDVSAEESVKQDKQLSYEEDKCLSENNSLAAVDLKSSFKKIEEVFKNKSTTYKYFWLLAILELINERKTMSLNYSDIIPRMVALAWNLLNKKISFGPKDSFSTIYRFLSSEFNLTSYTDEETVENLISKSYTHKKIFKIISILILNVPYRFLSPWIKYTTKQEVIIKSQSVNCDAPYALYDDFIVLDESWYDYFMENYEVLHKFTRTSLKDYLKSYNSELALLGLMMSDETH